MSAATSTSSTSNETSASVDLRTINTSSTFGSISPSVTRLIDCQVQELSSTFEIMFSADVFLPSCKVPVCLIDHVLSFPLHVPSPNVPSESNTHERICLAPGSQPMICIPDMSIRSPIITANERVKKFLFFVQSQSV